MQPETFSLLFLLAIVLLATGITMIAHLITPNQIAHRRGQADARARQARHDQMDAYLRGYNQEMYGHPDGPQPTHPHPARRSLAG